MDDLVGGLFMLVVAAFVIGALVAVALAMVAASAAVGSGIVGVRGTSEFLVSLTGRVRSRGGAARQPLAPEPAHELYVLGQLRRDLRSAGEDAWASMQSTRQLTGQFAASHNEGVTMPLGIGASVGGYLGTGLGVIVGVFLTLPVLIVAAVIMSGSWMLIGVLRGAEALRRRVRRTSYECPVDHERFPLPVYVCPGCGAEHRQLVPGRWGIIKRVCQCGKVALPTMVLNGRQRVPQRCPSGHPMAGIIGFVEILRVALVAGPRAGKSTFLAGALHELDQVSKAGTLALAVVDDSRSDFDAALDNLKNGRLPEKTQVGGNPALVAEVQGGGRSRVLSFYDVAGESYVGDEEIRDLRFLEVPSGLVMLIDPLALDRFAADHEDEIAAAEDRLRPSPVHPIRVLERMLGALGEAGAKVDKLPLAVVVGKTDALGIGDEIAALEQSAGGRAVPTWLESQGGGNFVRAIESDFETVGWFHASALGRVPDPADRSAFAPSGTADPVLWLLRQNGVVPAATKFSPTQAAERLSGADANDFPPISPRGWAWRAIPAGVVSLAVLAGLAIGVAAAVNAIPRGGSSPAYASDPSNTSGADDGESTTTTDDGSTGSGIPSDVTRGDLREKIVDVVTRNIKLVGSGEYRSAWNETLTQDYRRWKDGDAAKSTGEDGFKQWEDGQRSNEFFLNGPVQVRLSKVGRSSGVILAIVEDGVATAGSKGNPGLSCYCGYTWFKYENGRMLWDPGYRDIRERRRKLKNDCRNLGATVVGGCTKNEPISR